jgi:hypothetical protein
MVELRSDEPNRNDPFTTTHWSVVLAAGAGRHPCTGEDAVTVSRQIRSDKYVFEPPARHNPEIPPSLDLIVLKAVRRAPEDRYQSVAELIADLEAVPVAECIR